MCKAILASANQVAIYIHPSELDTMRTLLSEYILSNHAIDDTHSRKAVTLAGKIIASTDSIADALEA